MKRYAGILILLCIFANAAASDPLGKNDYARAAEYFKQIEKVFEKDGGKIWGKNFKGTPIFLVDPRTHEMIANCSDSANTLQLAKKQPFDLSSNCGDSANTLQLTHKTAKEAGGSVGCDSANTLQRTPEGVYKGIMPMKGNPANSVAEYGGKRWVMAMWPLPEDEFVRNVLLSHETFHYFQPMLGLDPSPALCNHLDEMYPRLYLKLEWNALEAAVNAKNKRKMKEAVSHALAFRAKRLSQAANPSEAEKNESEFLILEGLPEYSAYKMCCRDDRQMRKEIHKSRAKHFGNDSFVYSFAYHSGLAYGYLLDQAAKHSFQKGHFTSCRKVHLLDQAAKHSGGQTKDWRRSLSKESSLPDMLRARMDIKVPDNVDAFIGDYGYDSLYAFEHERDAKIKLQKEAYVSAFERDTVLEISFSSISMGFKPAQVQSLGALGTVYPNIRLSSDFGLLEVKDGGCLMSNGWQKATVPAVGIKVDGDKIYTDNWTLTLSPGHKLSPPSAKDPLKYTLE